MCLAAVLAGGCGDVEAYRGAWRLVCWPGVGVWAWAVSLGFTLTDSKPLGMGMTDPTGTGWGGLMIGSTWLGLPLAIGAGMPPPCLQGALGLGCAGLAGAPGAAGGPLGLNPNCLMSVLRGDGRGREGKGDRSAREGRKV